MWCKRRVEYLLGRELKDRVGDWRDLYYSLLQDGTSFDSQEDYSNSLLIPVLIEIGADPSENEGILYRATTASVEDYSLLLSYPEVKKLVNPTVLSNAISRSRRTDLACLLIDAAVSPSEYLQSQAVEEGWTDIVAALLRNGYFQPDEEEDLLKIACQYGFADICKLLLENKEAHNEERVKNNNYYLREAVIGSHFEVVQLLLQQEDVAPEEVIYLACRVSRIDVVRLLLSDERVQELGKRRRSARPRNLELCENKKRMLECARARNRRDVEELLL